MIVWFALFARLLYHPERLCIVRDEVIHEHGGDIAVGFVSGLLELADFFVDVREILFHLVEDDIRVHETRLRFLDLGECEKILEGGKRFVPDLQDAFGNGVDAVTYTIVVSFERITRRPSPLGVTERGGLVRIKRG